MPSIGDLANDVARTLYEFRVPVAILSVASAVGAVVMARRLGWFAAARRHPARAAAIGILVLAVAAPVGWYLGSPIFIRTSLVEDLPTAPPARAPVVTASPTPVPSPPATAVPTATVIPAPEATPTPVPSPSHFVASTLTSGEFVGTDEFHFGRGTASIVEIAPGRYHLRLDDFSVRNGPDLFVYLSPDPDGYDDAAVEVGVLKATDGSFGYDLPDGTDPDRYRSALIWCKQFSHLFAVASFDR